jgi:hypothetical protein
MSTRISSLAFAGLLAACGSAEVQPQADDGAQRIACAVGPGTRFGPDCLVERERRDGETLLVVRRPDGGYRRFVELGDGRGVEAADGADAVTSRYHDGVLEVVVAQERYRFPARDVADD